MSTDRLRIALTPEERKEWWAGVALEFRISAEGNVTIEEEWKGMDELYGDGCTITIPNRVWREAAPWITERLAALV